MNPNDEKNVVSEQTERENQSELSISDPRVPDNLEATPNTMQRQNIEQLLGGQAMPPYQPAGSAANYNPLNMETPANQNYWRGNLGHQPPTGGRGEGYVYKSDGEFIEQMKRERAQEHLGEGLRAPITAQRAAATSQTQPVMKPQPPTANAEPAQPIVPTPASQGRASDTTISSGDFRDSAGTQK